PPLAVEALDPVHEPQGGGRAEIGGEEELLELLERVAREVATHARADIRQRDLLDPLPQRFRFAGASKESAHPVRSFAIFGSVGLVRWIGGWRSRRVAAPCRSSGSNPAGPPAGDSGCFGRLVRPPAGTPRLQRNPHLRRSTHSVQSTASRNR